MIMLCFIALYCVELSLIDKTLCKTLLSFNFEVISANGEMCYLRGDYTLLLSNFVLDITFKRIH